MKKHDKPRKFKVSDEERQQGVADIAAKLAEAQRLVEQCVKIADRVGTSFRWEAARGMGGSYVSEEAARTSYWNETEETLEDMIGWQPSSQGC